MTTLPIAMELNNIPPLDPAPTANTSQAERINAIREEALVANPAPSAPLTQEHVIVPIQNTEREQGRSFDAPLEFKMLSIACNIIGLCMIFQPEYRAVGISLISAGTFLAVVICCRQRR